MGNNSISPNTRVVVVLGAAGFIGRHVSRNFHAQGFRVFGLGHGGWKIDEQLAWGISKWLESDITLESLSKIAGDADPFAFIHCAGSSYVAYSYERPYEDFQRSVDTTAILLEFVRQHFGGKSRIVMASSAAVYGDQGEVDLTESAARGPVSPYGFHKVNAELLCDSYSRFFGVTSSIVRLFSVYGEGLKKQLLWDALNKFAKSDAHFFGTGHEVRDWLHVEDAARLLFAAATMPQGRFEIYNGGSAKATTKEVLEYLAKSARPALSVTFSGETHIGNPRRLTANCSHAERQLNWTPEITLQEGLTRYSLWYQNGLGAS
jgi:UDP-glucose 4-epimerase